MAFLTLGSPADGAPFGRRRRARNWDQKGVADRSLGAPKDGAPPGVLGKGPRGRALHYDDAAWSGGGNGLQQQGHSDLWVLPKVVRRVHEHDVVRPRGPSPAAR